MGNALESNLNFGVVQVSRKVTDTRIDLSINSYGRFEFRSMA